MEPHNQNDDIVYPSSISFLVVHVLWMAVLWTGFTWRAAALGLALYVLRIFAITAGYHRYLAHRAYRTSWTGQFVLACLAQSSAQRGVLWWAAHHRRHHRYSDTVDDVHSPIVRGFFYSHLGWIFVARNDSTDMTAVPDLAKYPELRWLDRHPLLPAWALAASTYLIAGLP